MFKLSEQTALWLFQATEQPNFPVEVFKKYDVIGLCDVLQF